MFNREPPSRSRACSGDGMAQKKGSRMALETRLSFLPGLAPLIFEGSQEFLQAPCPRLTTPVSWEESGHPNNDQHNLEGLV